MICPPASAWRLHKAWPSSELKLIPKAGHAVSEPGIAAELVRTMDKLARQRETLGL
jgi:proline iminopeptidase